MRNISAKKSLVVAAVSLGATLTILMGASMISSGTQPSAASSAVSSAVPSSSWVLREYEGKIAVYAPGESEPAEVLDVYIDSLPDHDQSMLHKGIALDSQDEMQQLVEDYTG